MTGIASLALALTLSIAARSNAQTIALTNITIRGPTVVYELIFSNSLSSPVACKGIRHILNATSFLPELLQSRMRLNRHGKWQDVTLLTSVSDAEVAMLVIQPGAIATVMAMANTGLAIRVGIDYRVIPPDTSKRANGLAEDLFPPTAWSGDLQIGTIRPTMQSSVPLTRGTSPAKAGAAPESPVR